MTILAVDPGTIESAYVVYDVGKIRNKGIMPNEKLLTMLKNAESMGVLLAVEMVASFGMPVGEDVFETVLWTGRFIEAWGGPFELVYRQDVKMHLCKNTRAKDANIRQAILDRYPRTGGGKTPQIGTKKAKGPLYGCSSHIWSALAVAITADNKAA